MSARFVTESDQDRDVLTAAETERRASFGHLGRRTEFTLGRVAARTLAAERLAVPPDEVPLTVGADGAPQASDLYVSIAHTGRAGSVTALAAVADVPVGVDLERVAPRRSDLWRRILNTEEHDLLERLGGPTDDAQTLLWTLKEAVLKGQRTGFRSAGRSVVLSLESSQRLPEAGAPGRATATASGARWNVAFGRHGDLWLAAAWRPASHMT